MPDLLPLHPVNRSHLEAMTDDIGIMQHAIGSRRDPTQGYCTDDVARALQVDLLHQGELGWPAVARSAWRSYRFLEEAFDPGTGRFRNHRLSDGCWVEGGGSEDCHGRAMHTLGDVIATAPDRILVEAAAELFDRALPAAAELGSIRAISSVVLGCDAAIRGGSRGPASRTLHLLTGRLRRAFERGSVSGWAWPETRLTYENGLPARALIVAGRHGALSRTTEIGLGVLDWLISVQTSPDDHFSFVGTGWWAVGGSKSQFDQQPIEATALLLAAESAHAATGYERYRSAMEQAYGWFLGENDLGVMVADPARGASYDGLTTGGINENQGAESTLMWLVALEQIRALRRMGQPTSTAARPHSLVSAT
jgi:hypothetical protein